MLKQTPAAAGAAGGFTKRFLSVVEQKPGEVQRVVLIPFPHAQARAIGFVTRVLDDAEGGGKIAAVYVPTSPNPTSGFFLMMPRADVVPLDMSVDEALKYIISMGVVAPPSRRALARRSTSPGG